MTASTDDPPRPRLTLPVAARDHLRGAADAPVTLVEYGDFECPDCGRAYGVVRELERRAGDRVRFVYRHFPLTNIHPHAQRAAEAAEWAASLGAFWPMHDALFEAQADLSEACILAIAGRLGLPAPALATAWRDHVFFPRVKEDFLGGIRSGAKGTPTFFVDGVRHDGQWEVDDLVRAVGQSSA